MNDSPSLYDPLRPTVDTVDLFTSITVEFK